MGWYGRGLGSGATTGWNRCTFGTSGAVALGVGAAGQFRPQLAGRMGTPKFLTPRRRRCIPSVMQALVTALVGVGADPAAAAQPEHLIYYGMCQAPCGTPPIPASGVPVSPARPRDRLRAQIRDCETQA